MRINCPPSLWLGREQEKRVKENVKGESLKSKAPASWGVSSKIRKHDPPEEHGGKPAKDRTSGGVGGGKRRERRKKKPEMPLEEIGMFHGERTMQSSTQGVKKGNQDLGEGGDSVLKKKKRPWPPLPFWPSEGSHGGKYAKGAMGKKKREGAKISPRPRKKTGGSDLKGWGEGGVVILGEA